MVVLTLLGDSWLCGLSHFVLAAGKTSPLSPFWLGGHGVLLPFSRQDKLPIPSSPSHSLPFAWKPFLIPVPVPSQFTLAVPSKAALPSFTGTPNLMLHDTIVFTVLSLLDV